MDVRARFLRSMLVVFATPFVAACSSAAPGADAPATDTAPRVFLEAMVLDVPSGGVTTVGKWADAAKVTSFGDLAAQVGARHVVSPHFLVANDVTARLSRPTTFANGASAVDAAFATYRLEIKPHVAEPGRVRLDVDFDLADTHMRTTFDVNDRQVCFLGTNVVVDDRRFLLVLRPNIVRNDAELRALFDERSAQPPTGM